MPMRRTMTQNVPITLTEIFYIKYVFKFWKLMKNISILVVFGKRPINLGGEN